MPQNYYTYSNTFIDGQTAKATEVRDEFEAVQSGLDAFYDDTNTPMVVAAVAAQAAAEYAQALAETARTGAETAETNAQTAEANANTVLADVNQSALVSANHYGDWTALTGALNKPAAVSHNNAQWILKNNLADVMLSEPGVSADWGEIGGIGEHYQEFLVSGTWTKPTGVKWVYVEAIGGGAGGQNYTTAYFSFGGGGGAFVSKIFRANDVGATETVTVGAGGAGKANGTSGNGGNGGASTFGSLLNAPGGYAGGDPRGGCGELSSSSGSVLGSQGGYGSGAGGTGTMTDAGQGGNSIMGGAGGGATRGNNTAASLGGTSLHGGSGGNGVLALNVPGGNGQVPGGGGGGSSNDGGGGTGGDGRVRVWAW